MINKVKGLLGISAKAGSIVSGTDIVLEEMSNGKISLVIIASDASEKTIKNMKYYCEKEKVPIFVYGTIEENSKSIGKKNRAVIGIKNKNLAEEIKKVISGGEEFEKN